MKLTFIILKMNERNRKQYLKLNDIYNEIFIPIPQEKII
jgi:hypothetical protein